MNIKQIYLSILNQSIYDESYAGNQQLIDNKIHGVCIDFSRNLIAMMRQNNYRCGLISTLNDDGFLHAAVIYEDKETKEILIADPVTDIKQLLEKSTDDIMNNCNYKINLEMYVKTFGPITDYDDSEYDETKKPSQPKILRQNMTNKYMLLSNPYIINLSKNVEPIQQLSNIEDVKRVADVSTLLACEKLYEKGINTFCSNYNVETGHCDIAINYNSLSPENKKIILELAKDKPEQYKIFDNRKVFGYPNLHRDSSICDEIFPMVVCIGYKDKNDFTPEEMNIKMYDLIKMFQKQKYMQGVYTREDVLNNKHNYMKLNLIKLEVESCNSTNENTNEEIAIKEKLIYSKQYQMFFEDYICLSRYIESIYRKENDWRTTEQIAQDENISFDGEKFIDESAVGYSVDDTNITEKRSFLSRLKEMIASKTNNNNRSKR